MRVSFAPKIAIRVPAILVLSASLVNASTSGGRQQTIETGC
jgi:hypothetical protein